MVKKYTPILIITGLLLFGIFFVNSVLAQDFHTQKFYLGKVYPGQTVEKTIEFDYHGEPTTALVQWNEISNDNGIIYEYDLPETIELKEGLNKFTFSLHIEFGTPVGRLSGEIKIIEVEDE